MGARHYVPWRRAIPRTLPCWCRSHNVSARKFGHTKDIWSWTGYTWEELMRPGETPDKLELLHLIDILVDGRYLRDQKDSLLRFLRLQKPAHPRCALKSLEAGEVRLNLGEAPRSRTRYPRNLFERPRSRRRPTGLVVAVLECRTQQYRWNWLGKGLPVSEITSPRAMLGRWSD